RNATAVGNLKAVSLSPFADSAIALRAIGALRRAAGAGALNAAGDCDIGGECFLELLPVRGRDVHRVGHTINGELYDVNVLRGEWRVVDVVKILGDLFACHRVQQLLNR